MAEKKKAAVTAAAENSDKKKALEAAISKIEKDYGKGTIMRLGDDISVNVEALSTGSLSLDLALGIGGIPRGRIVEIYGPEASGKTTLALHVVASAQRNGGDEECRLTEWRISIVPAHHASRLCFHVGSFADSGLICWEIAMRLRELFVRRLSG